MRCSVRNLMCRLVCHLYNCIFLAETEPHEGKRKVESLWPIFKVHHQKSRYIYDLFYRRKAISRGMLFQDLYDPK